MAPSSVSHLQIVSFVKKVKDASLVLNEPFVAIFNAGFSKISIFDCFGTFYPNPADCKQMEFTITQEYSDKTIKEIREYLAEVPSKTKINLCFNNQSRNTIWALADDFLSHKRLCKL